MGALAAAVAILAPVVFAPGLLFYYDVTPKVVVLMVGTAAAALFLRIEDLARLSARADGRRFALLIALQSVSVLVSTLWSAHPLLSIAGTHWRRYGLFPQSALLLFALSAAVAALDPAWLRRLLRGTAVAGLAAAIYGVAQYFGVDPWIAASAYHIGVGEAAIVRPPSTLGHASYAAGYYLHAIFFAVALLGIEPRREWRRLAAATIAAGSCALILSGTRAAILGALIGAAVLAIGYRHRVTRRRVAAVTLACAFAAVFYMAPPGEKLRARLRWSLEDPAGGARLLLWRDAGMMAGERPLIGWGLETFSAEFPRFQSRELARAYPDFYHESPHNIFLDALTAQGLLGAAILAAMCWMGASGAWRHRSSKMHLALGAGLAAALVSQQFVSFSASTAICFYVTVAILIASPEEAPPPPLAGGRRMLARFIMMPSAVVLTAFAVELAAADYGQRVVQRHFEAGRIAEAAREYENLRSSQPWGVNSDLWYSRSLARFGKRDAEDYRAAIDAARQATVAAEDRHNAFYNLATLCGLAGDAACAGQALRDAIHWSPRWFKPHWTLAQVLQLAGKGKEAEAEAALAVDLDAGKHPEVARTLEAIRAGNSR